MIAVLQAVAWYGAFTLAGVAGLALVRRAGFAIGEGWAVARPVGAVGLAYVGWCAGLLGAAHWWWWGAAAGVALLALLRLRLTGREWRSAAAAEAVGVSAFLVIVLLRFPVLDVAQTEKPMDLALLATLMRPAPFPPLDPWLAGHTMAYYYWGLMPFAMIGRWLSIAPDVTYNLSVPMVAAMTAMAAWALARRLGARTRLALAAPALAVLGGTLDGWRQWLSGTPLGTLDLWSSSRQITGAITEFPLFSFRLGDLHPHLTTLPLVLAAAVVAARAARSRLAWLAAVMVYGAAAAGNPWAAIPAGALIAAMMLAPPEGIVWPGRRGWARWAATVGVGVAGFVCYLPFWLAYRSPVLGFGVVSTPTHWDQLALFLGGMIVLPVSVAVICAWRWGGIFRSGRQLFLAFWLASATVIAALTGSVGLALAVGVCALAAAQMLRQGHRPLRPAWAVTALAFALVGLFETIYVRDPYGADFYRMNTVFKASFLAFALLAAVTPVWGEWLRRRTRWIGTGVIVFVLLAGTPQLAGLLGAGLAAGPHGWGGLGWMTPGDRAAAVWLRGRPPGTSFIEAVSDPYSDAGRLSAASGVPAVLGWPNHERVWRGDGIRSELAARRDAVRELYSCGDPARVREIARTLGTTLVAIGSVERRLYPAEGLAAVRAAGRIVFDGGDCVVVDVGA